MATRKLDQLGQPPAYFGRVLAFSLVNGSLCEILDWPAAEEVAAEYERAIEFLRTAVAALGGGGADPSPKRDEKRCKRTRDQRVSELAYLSAG